MLYLCRANFQFAYELKEYKMKHPAFTLYIILFLSSLSLQAQQIKIGNYTFPGGGEYQGEMFKGKPYGKGKTVYPNGDWHEGEYVKGKRQGQGIYQFADGEKYEGEWYGDQQHGKGTYYFANNNRYEGLWFKDYQQGLGTMYYYNGDTYVGSWMQDKREGTGKYTYAQGGAYYEGQWKNDMKDGQGTFDWMDGNRYEGFWKENQKHGKGTFTYSTGDSYTGDWADDQQHGRGIFSFADGNRYEGQYVHGQRTGEGVYTFANGDKYAGHFSSGEQDGQGTFTWHTGASYVGQWKHNKQHGTGKYRWANGDEEAVAEHTVGEGENAGIITWTYTRNSETLLTFTLKRDAGEEEGEYPVTAEGEETQSNYIVDYQQGVFGILAVLDVDVTQPVVDDTDPNANPSYTYTATLDLTGTGLTEYNKNGFVEVDGVPTLSFTLPEERENIKTLKVPGGAKLTVRQDTTDDNYTTSLSMDGAPVASEEDPVTCVLDTVDTYHEIAFTHSRISLPVSAKAAVGQTEEGAVTLEGRKGAMGVPDSSRAIDADFADEMHSKIGYVLPADKYYVYDHASLYTTSGSALEGATNVTEIRYNRETAGWEYKTNREYTSVPEGAQLVLFYLPKYVCKIGTEKFYTLRAAVEYADENGKTATIEMLIQDYSIRSASELVTIPADCQITITTAATEYEGTDTAVINRSMGLTGGHLFTNNGSLTFDNIILDGKNVRATDAAIRNNAEAAELTVAQGAVLRNASGVNGGAIYVNAGTVNVNGALSGNTATNGGAVYVNAGTVNLAGSLSGNPGTKRGCQRRRGLSERRRTDGQRKHGRKQRLRKRRWRLSQQRHMHD